MAHPSVTKVQFMEYVRKDHKDSVMLLTKIRDLEIEDEYGDVLPLFR